MRTTRTFGPACSFLWVVLGISLAALTVQAQRHTATRLGAPDRRFAPPLRTVDDLRALFADEKLKPDVLSILRQAGWSGDVHDFWRAASTAAVHEVRLPKGTRIPYMSAREKGRPIVLQDVLWAGAEPIAAYEFTFDSKGMRYRVVTPKACSNFWLEEAGPAPPPFVPRRALALAKTMPPEVSLCAPFETTLTVRNTGNVPLTKVQVTDALAPAFRSTDGRESVVLDAGELGPGQGVEFKLMLKPMAAGTQENRATAAAAEGVTAEAADTTAVRAPVLALQCTAPPEVVAGRPATVCLSVKNTGEAAEPQATLTLPVPAGAKAEGVSAGGTVTAEKIVWQLPALAPGAENKVCAAFSLEHPGAMQLTASAQGTCAPAVETACAVQVAGIPAVLLEVVDLDDPIEVGSNEVYEIRVTNQGSAIGTNIRVVCTLEESQQFVSGTGATPMNADGRRIASEPLPVLDPKAKATWRVTVKALTVGDVRFAVQLTSDEIVRPVEETEATHQY